MRIYSVLKVRLQKNIYENPVTIAGRPHLFPSRTQKLSSLAPMILGGKLPGKVGRCQFIWLHGQAVKTPPFHGGNPGSIPGGVTNTIEEWELKSSHFSNQRRKHSVRKWLRGRASPCQGEGREFESRLPLQFCGCSSMVEPQPSKLMA